MAMEFNNVGHDAPDRDIQAAAANTTRSQELFFTCDTGADLAGSQSAEITGSPGCPDVSNHSDCGGDIDESLDVEADFDDDNGNLNAAMFVPHLGQSQNNGKSRHLKHAHHSSGASTSDGFGKGKEKFVAPSVLEYNLDQILADPKTKIGGFTFGAARYQARLHKPWTRQHAAITAQVEFHKAGFKFAGTGNADPSHPLSALFDRTMRHIKNHFDWLEGSSTKTTMYGYADSPDVRAAHNAVREAAKLFLDGHVGHNEADHNRFIDLLPEHGLVLACRFISPTGSMNGSIAGCLGTCGYAWLMGIKTPPSEVLVGSAIGSPSVAQNPTGDDSDAEQDDEDPTSDHSESDAEADPTCDSSNPALTGELASENSKFTAKIADCKEMIVKQCIGFHTRMAEAENIIADLRNRPDPIAQVSAVDLEVKKAISMVMTNFDDQNQEFETIRARMDETTKEFADQYHDLESIIDKRISEVTQTAMNQDKRIADQDERMSGLLEKHETDIYRRVLNSADLSHLVSALVREAVAQTFGRMQTSLYPLPTDAQPQRLGEGNSTAPVLPAGESGKRDASPRKEARNKRQKSSPEDAMTDEIDEGVQDFEEDPLITALVNWPNRKKG
ncbi:hypothetical protein ACO1O0_004809 [Amphichorda felina]